MHKMLPKEGRGRGDRKGGRWDGLTQQCSHNPAELGRRKASTPLSQATAKKLC